TPASAYTLRQPEPQPQPHHLLFQHLRQWPTCHLCHLFHHSNVLRQFLAHDDAKGLLPMLLQVLVSCIIRMYVCMYVMYVCMFVCLVVCCVDIATTRPAARSVLIKMTSESKNIGLAVGKHSIPSSSIRLTWLEIVLILYALSDICLTLLYTF